MFPGNETLVNVWMLVLASCRITRISEPIVLRGIFKALDISFSESHLLYNSITLAPRRMIFSLVFDKALNRLLFHSSLVALANILPCCGFHDRKAYPSCRSSPKS